MFLEIYFILIENGVQFSFKIVDVKNWQLASLLKSNLQIQTIKESTNLVL